MEAIHKAPDAVCSGSQSQNALVAYSGRLIAGRVVACVVGSYTGCVMTKGRQLEPFKPRDYSHKYRHIAFVSGATLESYSQVA